MFEKLFPQPIDNQYRGMPIAKWLFVAMTLLTVGRSLAHIFLPDGGAQSIATIALNTFSPSASAVIVGMFAYWGLSQLLFGLLFVLVLWRYQSLIPLMSLFIFIEWTGRLLLGFYKPIETVGTAPGAIGNQIFPVLAFIMLVLALVTPLQKGQMSKNLRADRAKSLRFSSGSRENHSKKDQR